MQATGIAQKMGVKVRVPNLKDLVTKPGAVAGLLRSIMNFLKLRFPAFAGMNVLWSLALFGQSHHPPLLSFHQIYSCLPSPPHSPSHPNSNPPLEFTPLTPSPHHSPPLRILVLPQTRPRSPPRERTPPHRSRNRRAGRENPKRAPGRLSRVQLGALAAGRSFEPGAYHHGRRGREYGGGPGGDVGVEGHACGARC